MIITGSLLISKSLANMGLWVTGSSYFTGSEFLATASKAYLGNGAGYVYVNGSSIKISASSFDMSGIPTVNLGIVSMSQGGLQINLAAAPNGFIVKHGGGYVGTGANLGIPFIDSQSPFEVNSFAVQNTIPRIDANRDVNSSIIQDDGTNIGIGGAIDASYKAKVYGNLGVTGTIYESSTIKIKENIQTLSDELSNILKIRPIEFDYIETKEHSYGFIAEELNDVYPDAVIKDENSEPIGVAYPDLTSPIIRSIQQLAEKIDYLAKRVEELESR